jgi:hypothetical protein
MPFPMIVACSVLEAVQTPAHAVGTVSRLAPTQHVSVTVATQAEIAQTRAALVR